MDPPAPKFDEQQYVERLEPGSLDGEEVARDDPLRLSSEELGPSGSGPPRGGTESRGPEQGANGRGRYPDPELGELRAPTEVATVAARSHLVIRRISFLLSECARQKTRPRQGRAAWQVRENYLSKGGGRRRTIGASAGSSQVGDRPCGRSPISVGGRWLRWLSSSA